METALIFGSYGYPSWGFLKQLLGKASVICADGGLLCAHNAGFPVNYYIGDGDSGGNPPEGIEAVLLEPEKDLTDLQAAYEFAKRRGFTRIVLTACTGGRQDHHLANLQLLETAWHAGIEARILDPWNEIRYLNGGNIQIPHGEYRYFSVLPMDQELHDVRIINAKYPLNVPRVRRGDSLTVSNETIDGPAQIWIGTGAAWIIRSDPLQ